MDEATIEVLKQGQKSILDHLIRIEKNQQSNTSRITKLEVQHDSSKERMQALEERNDKHHTDFYGNGRLIEVMSTKLEEMARIAEHQTVNLDKVIEKLPEKVDKTKFDTVKEEVIRLVTKMAVIAAVGSIVLGGLVGWLISKG